MERLTTSLYPDQMPKYNLDWEAASESCVICGGLIREGEEMAEMFDKAANEDPEMWSEAEGGVVHAECGINKGWAIA